MEQPRVQIQNESSSEMINRVLACGKCMKDITTSGHCECVESFIISGSDKNGMEFYREYFLHIIKYFIQIRVPNLSPVNGNVAFGNDTNGSREAYHYGVNGLKVEFGPWETEYPAQNFSSSPPLAVSDSVSEGFSEPASSGSQQNLNITYENSEQSLISSPCEEKIEGDDKKSESIQLRLTTLTYISGKSAVILDILGQRLDWQQILQHLESNTVDLRWRFYNVDGIFDLDSDTDDENDDDGFNRGPPPASKWAIESLPTVCLDNGDAICCICTDTLHAGGEAKQLPCNHCYHVECIVAWLSVRNLCPLCRYELPSGVEVDENDQRQ